jgi:hypothetical protein
MAPKRGDVKGKKRCVRGAIMPILTENTDFWKVFWESFRPNSSSGKWTTVVRIGTKISAKILSHQIGFFSRSGYKFEGKDLIIPGISPSLVECFPCKLGFCLLICMVGTKKIVAQIEKNTKNNGREMGIHDAPYTPIGYPKMAKI